MGKPSRQMKVSTGDLVKDIVTDSSSRQSCETKLSALRVLMSLNWLKVAHSVIEFFIILQDTLDIPILVQVAEVIERPVSRLLLADMVFRELEFQEKEYQNGKSQLVAKAMSDYFTQPSNLQYFFSHSSFFN